MAKVRFKLQDRPDTNPDDPARLAFWERNTFYIDDFVKPNWLITKRTSNTPDSLRCEVLAHTTGGSPIVRARNVDDLEHNPTGLTDYLISRMGVKVELWHTDENGTLVAFQKTLFGGFFTEITYESKGVEGWWTLKATGWKQLLDEITLSHHYLQTSFNNVSDRDIILGRASGTIASTIGGLDVVLAYDAVPSIFDKSVLTDYQGRSVPVLINPDYIETGVEVVTNKRYNRRSIAAVLDDLARDSNFDWYVDADRFLHYGSGKLDSVKSYVSQKFGAGFLKTGAIVTSTAVIQVHGNLRIYTAMNEVEDRVEATPATVPDTLYNKKHQYEGGKSTISVRTDATHTHVRLRAEGSPQTLMDYQQLKGMKDVEVHLDFQAWPGERATKKGVSTADTALTRVNPQSHYTDYYFSFPGGGTLLPGIYQLTFRSKARALTNPRRSINTQRIKNHVVVVGSYEEALVEQEIVLPSRFEPDKWTHNEATVKIAPVLGPRNLPELPEGAEFTFHPVAELKSVSSRPDNRLTFVVHPTLPTDDTDIVWNVRENTLTFSLNNGVGRHLAEYGSRITMKAANAVAIEGTAVDAASIEAYGQRTLIRFEPKADTLKAATQLAETLLKQNKVGVEQLDFMDDDDSWELNTQFNYKDAAPDAQQRNYRVNSLHIEPKSPTLRVYQIGAARLQDLDLSSPYQ